MFGKKLTNKQVRLHNHRHIIEYKWDNYLKINVNLYKYPVRHIEVNGCALFSRICKTTEWLPSMLWASLCRIFFCFSLPTQEKYSLQYKQHHCIYKMYTFRVIQVFKSYTSKSIEYSYSSKVTKQFGYSFLNNYFSTFKAIRLK